MHEGISEQDFHRLHPKLTGHFRRQGASSEEARDLSQETLLRAHKNRHSFEGRSDYDTWVVSIGKLVWLQHGRNQRREKRSGEEIPMEDFQDGQGPTSRGPDPEENAVAGELAARTNESMRALPELMRQALMLFVQGHKYRAIAVLLGTTENKVSSLIYQARAKLRRQVQP